MQPAGHDNNRLGVARRDALPDPGDAQVVFCSRTHSQLSQFVAELRRTEFADRVSGASPVRAPLCHGA